MTDDVVEPHAHVWEATEVVVSRWVLADLEPSRMVIHHDAGDWSVVCGTVDSPEQLVGMPLSWLRDRSDVGHRAVTLRPGRMLTRDDPSEPWVRRTPHVTSERSAPGDQPRRGRTSRRVAPGLQTAERRLLEKGLGEWWGPARAPEGLTSALSFAGIEHLDTWLPQAKRRLHAQEPMTPLDWLRCLVLTEIAFVSDVFGSGTEWSTTTGLTDEETIRLLRTLQYRLGPVVAEVRSGEDGGLS